MDPYIDDRQCAEELDNERELREMEANPPSLWIEYGCLGVILIILALSIGTCSWPAQ